MNPKDEMPEDFAARAAVETDAQLRARYGIGWAKLVRFRKACGVPSIGRVYGKVPIPADFVDVATGRTVRQVSRHYGRSRDMVKRWSAETGVAVVRDKPGKEAAEPKPAATTGKRPSVSEPYRSAMQPTPSATRIARDMSPAGQAADYLRQFGAVFRCNDAGAPSIGGKFWRRGTAVLNDADLIGRAEYVRSKRAAALSGSLGGNATGML